MSRPLLCAYPFCDQQVGTVIDFGPDEPSEELVWREELVDGQGRAFCSEECWQKLNGPEEGEDRAEAKVVDEEDHL